MHTKSQVDVLICTFLVLTNLFCSAVIAALWCRKHSRFLRFLLSSSSGVFLSLMSLYCSLLRWRRSSICIQHGQWTPPSIIQLTHVETVIYSDNSPWHILLHIQSNNLCCQLIRDMNHYTHLYGSTVINVNRIRSMANLMLEAHVRYPLCIIKESITPLTR